MVRETAKSGEQISEGHAPFAAILADDAGKPLPR